MSAPVAHERHNDFAHICVSDSGDGASSDVGRSAGIGASSGGTLEAAGIRLAIAPAIRGCIPTGRLVQVLVGVSGVDNVGFNDEDRHAIVSRVEGGAQGFTQPLITCRHMQAYIRSAALTSKDGCTDRSVMPVGMSAQVRCYK